MNIPGDRGRVFHHEAFFYSTDDEFLAGTVPFIRGAVAAGEPALVALSDDKIRMLREELSGEVDNGLVSFADMAEIGRNPACIIPIWRRFVDEYASDGRQLRGIGEPIWRDRTAAELVECEHHESLMNLALANAPELWLLCPYDENGLAEEVLEAARLTHPFLVEAGIRRKSDAYVEPREAGSPFTGPLPEPPGHPQQLAFSASRLRALRVFVAARAQKAGLDPYRTRDLVLAVTEIASNSVLHAGGGGVLRAWLERDSLVCEVRDAGRIVEPLVGRDRPLPDQLGGRGVWVANNLCDLVQVRSSLTGTVIRLHMRLS